MVCAFPSWRIYFCAHNICGLLHGIYILERTVFNIASGMDFSFFIFEHAKDGLLKSSGNVSIHSRFSHDVVGPQVVTSILKANASRIESRIRVRVSRIYANLIRATPIQLPVQSRRAIGSQHHNAADAKNSGALSAPATASFTTTVPPQCL